MIAQRFVRIWVHNIDQYRTVTARLPSAQCPGIAVYGMDGTTLVRWEGWAYVDLNLVPPVELALVLIETGLVVHNK